jgi:hypothetical protein
VYIVESTGAFDLNVVEAKPGRGPNLAHTAVMSVTRQLQQYAATRATKRR